MYGCPWLSAGGNPISHPMLPVERHEIILRRLAEDGRVLASTLSRDLGASQDTIRRDLRDLAEAGWCRRVYGGALPISSSTTLREREVQAQARKAALARKAVAIIRPGDVLLIDAGTTNTAIARTLPEERALTVVTNAPSIAATLTGRSGIDVVILGGRLDHRSGGALGTRTVDEVRCVRADLCFVGTCAVAADCGLSAFDQEEAALKAVIMQASRGVVAVVTSDRLDTRAPFIVAPTSILTHLVVEAGTDARLLSPFIDAGVTIHVAGDLTDG
jgi:DeoR/GlpR family transcriptional regulator of sugar metabolism